MKKITFFLILLLVVLFVKTSKANAAAPTVSTSAETNVDAFSTTLNGTVNPNSIATSSWYLWGPSNVACSSLPNSTTSQSLGSGGDDVALTAALSGFVPGVTYYYCAVGVNSSGITYSSVSSFTQASASGCGSVSLSTDYTAASSCVFANSTTDGVDKGTGTQNDAVLTVAKGTTLTIGANQAIAYGAIYKPGATVVRLSGGSLRRGAIWVADTDADGYPDNPGTQGQLTQATQPAGYVRRAGIAGAALDCDSSDAAKFKNYIAYSDGDEDGYAATSTQSLTCSGATLAAGLSITSSGVDCLDSNATVFTNRDVATDVDQDGYSTSTTSSQCAGASSTVSGRTYYKNASNVALFIDTASTIATSDCNDASTLVQTSTADLATDTDQDGYFTGSGSTQCVGAATSTVSSRTYYRTSSGTYDRILSTPTGGANAISATTDCNDADVAKYQNLMIAGDVDGDGVPNSIPTSTCSGSSAGAGYTANPDGPAFAAQGSAAYHNCVVRYNGTVMCWGYGGYGQIGAGLSSSYPTPLNYSTFTNSSALVSGITTAKTTAGSVASGYGHSCVVLTDGTVKCWGRNNYGQLGNGDTTDSNVPVQVSGISTATAVSAGEYYSCALLADSTIKCWGYNFYGQLGNGNTTTPQLIPVAVSGISTATAVSAGAIHACALLADSTIKCWGYGGLGNLGNGGNGNSSTAVAVSGISTATMIAVGYYHSCAVLADSTIKCWGYNVYGQLGNATTTDSNVPVQVSGISTATAVSGGGNHSCALLADGSAKCWGRNLTGQLGLSTNDGTNNANSTPLAVSGISGATQISTGVSHTCVILSSGTQSIKCWGDNTYYQLGVGTTVNTYTAASVIQTFGLDPDDNDNTKTKLDFVKTDTDGDGWGTGSSIQLSYTGATIPSGYGTANSDCNDASATVQYDKTSYVDADSDTYYAASATVCASYSVGATVGCANDNQSKNASDACVYTTNPGTADCYDSNANAKPGQTSYFTSHRGDGSYDYSCASGEEKNYGGTQYFQGPSHRTSLGCGPYGCACANFTGVYSSTAACGQAYFQSMTGDCNNNNYSIYTATNCTGSTFAGFSPTCSSGPYGISCGSCTGATATTMGCR